MIRLVPKHPKTPIDPRGVGGMFPKKGVKQPNPLGGWIAWERRQGKGGGEGDPSKLRELFFCFFFDFGGF